MDSSSSSTGSGGRPILTAGIHGGGGGGKGGGGGNRGLKDGDIGKTVRIIKGGLKGHLGLVLDATPTHYRLELTARMKKIDIEKDKTMVVGSKEGSLAGDNNRISGGYNYNADSIEIASTPFMMSETPRHYGAETPKHNGGGETPNAYGGDTPMGNIHVYMRCCSI